LNTVVEKALGPNGKDPAVLADLQRYATVTQASERFRGIPFPGTFMLDRGGRVTARFFELLGTQHRFQHHAESGRSADIGACPASLVRASGSEGLPE
jgi:hypothetical protein